MTVPIAFRSLIARLTGRNPVVLHRRLTTLTTLWTIALWGSLALGLALGRGRINVFTTTPFSEDLLIVHAAGTIMRTCPPAALYDDDVERVVQARTLGPVGREVFNRYMAPPHTAAMFSPLSRLPFALVAWLWGALALAGVFAVPRLLGAPHPLRASVLTLAFVPVFDGFAAGQNAIASLFLFALALHCWQRDRGWLAGIALGLVAVWKPQLVVGVVLLFLLDVRRDPRPLAGVTLVLVSLAAIDLLWLPAQTAHFLAWGTSVVAGDEPLWRNLRPGGELTVVAFFELLLPQAPRAAHHLAWLCQLGALVAFVLTHRHVRGRAAGHPLPSRRDDRILFACAALLTLWLTPHALLYEWTLLVLPAMVLWVEQPRVRAPLLRVFALLAVVTPLSLRLARVQLGLFGMAVHPAVPLLLAGSALVLQQVWRPDWRTRAARLRLRLGGGLGRGAGLPDARKS
jgi:alpha-1,2-mannosyltransferase